jgi:hypothetical protein
MNLPQPSQYRRWAAVLQDLVPLEMKKEMQRRTNWGHLLTPANYNLPASRQPHSAPRPPDW